MSGKILDHVIKANFAQQICLNHHRYKESIFYCLIVVLSDFLCASLEKNEHSAEQSVNINAKNMCKLFSTFGKAQSMSSLAIYILNAQVVLSVATIRLK